MTLSPEQKRELVIQGNPEKALRDALERPKVLKDLKIESVSAVTDSPFRDTGDECGCDSC